MTNQLESLRKHSVVVADTGDIDAVARWKPQDATTNPSLLLASAADPRYRPLLERAMAQAGGDAALSMDWLFVQFGREILKHVAGRVSTEVDARLSFDFSASKDSRASTSVETRPATCFRISRPNCTNSQSIDRAASPPAWAIARSSSGR